MSVHCDECQEYVHDKEEFKFLFKIFEANSNYDYSLSLCSSCFDDKFSIKRYARLAAQETQFMEHKKKIICCSCDASIDKKKDIYHSIRCFDNKVALEIFYCRKCYKEDVG